MKASSVVLTLLFLTPLGADDALDRARQLEKSGDVAGARMALSAAAQRSSSDVEALREYADFLNRYGDPESRAAYIKAFEAAEKAGDRDRMAAVARELVILDLVAGDRAAAAQHIEAYHAAGGKAWLSPPTWKPALAQTDPKQMAYVPGPLRSFNRMAAISSEINSEDVLPALARNVVTNGYQASHSNEALEQTEYLKLVHRTFHRHASSIRWLAQTRCFVWRPAIRRTQANCCGSSDIGCAGAAAAKLCWKR